MHSPFTDKVISQIILVVLFCSKMTYFRESMTLTDQNNWCYSQFQVFSINSQCLMQIFCTTYLGRSSNISRANRRICYQFSSKQKQQRKSNMKFVSNQAPDCQKPLLIFLLLNFQIAFFFALLAIAFAAPEPEAKADPQILAYAGYPYAYSAYAGYPYAYTYSYPAVASAVLLKK
jgi:hypothetical protein